MTALLFLLAVFCTVRGAVETGAEVLGLVWAGVAWLVAELLTPVDERAEG